jgi:hypothetical protein
VLHQIVGAGDERHANELIEERRIMAAVWGPEATPTTFVRALPTSPVANLTIAWFADCDVVR